VEPGADARRVFAGEARDECGRAVVISCFSERHNGGMNERACGKNDRDGNAERAAGKTRDGACAVVARSTESPGRWGGDLLPLASSRHPRMAALPEL
jgi:hypothetical protein